jgi:hypothetical protein
MFLAYRAANETDLGSNVLFFKFKAAPLGCGARRSDDGAMQDCGRCDRRNSREISGMTDLLRIPSGDEWDSKLFGTGIAETQSKLGLTGAPS